MRWIRWYTRWVFLFTANASLAFIYALVIGRFPLLVLAHTLAALVCLWAMARYRRLLLALLRQARRHTDAIVEQDLTAIVESDAKLAILTNAVEGRSPFQHVSSHFVRKVEGL